MKPGWLYGWKDIASFVGCDITTIKRYAKTYCLPIRRFPNNKPVAIPDEMNDWLKRMEKPRK